MRKISRRTSHGKIGEAAAYAKCWMHGIPAYFTGGLKANFAESDLIVNTDNPRTKLWVQVKTGIPSLRKNAYLTQCSDITELDSDKFESDFIIFINIDPKIGKHEHNGELDFSHLKFFVLPRCIANDMYRKSLEYWYKKPKKNGEVRKLTNMAVYTPEEHMPEMNKYLNAWHLIQSHSG